MMCPVCKRDLAPTLSICMTCGAMINDTVREELETKISRPGVSAASNSGGLVAKSPTSNTLPKSSPMTSGSQPGIAQPKPRMEAPKIEAPKPMAQPAQPKPIAHRFNTADLRVKKTSPTLVEFQTKKATVPEWRLQLQNSVRQKVGTNRRDNNAPAAPTPQATPQSTNGANALKVEFIEDEQPAKHQNPRVANALKRIEESRRAFSNQPNLEQPLQSGKAATAQKNFPFNVVARSGEPPARKPGQKATVNPSPKPILVSSLKIEKKGYDTNKLPPIAKPATPSRSFIPAAPPQQTTKEIETIAVTEDVVEMETLGLEPETDEIDDLAPFSMRFSAGLFDMIIGVFASLILLSPFIISGGTWLSVYGFFAVAATVAIVMFVYLTSTIAFVGRTFGMRLFSLELVDIEENAYPTLHQAAVSSAVFMLSLIFAGIGFLPMFFNEERRAAHDILSGTILIREY